ncbi:uncharacterized protein LOC111695659 isoform X2 [Eurytemora carolleeae]|uniref:uncharacterized protein LOC111695659 isoform X2 n=1 Tax=Eurytemora carolleeae TaxID=1294199 RepID=UPI000C78B8AB|nr:uncharacterized protein LOC111695659 isoform X2 [Eurytemora carolleeae]|eukprot:XP_023320825.1 uncharacterized protein LOC111695659 isoform X2 [Eurytemora affinis]
MLKIDLFCLESTEMFDCSVTLVFLALLVSGLHANQDHVEVLEPGIYLSINPLAFTQPDGTIIKRRLEITWYGKQTTDKDVIKLNQGLETVLEIYPALYQDGFYTTNFQLPYPDVQEIGTNSLCVFDYSVRWLVKNDNNTEELASACLRSQPSWMWENREFLKEMKIGSMMLAASHLSGAYRDYLGEGDNNLATSAVYAQEEDIQNQLVWGARFLDIRVGYYPTLEDTFWLVHGIIKTHPMQEGIRQVQEYLRSSKDIVVWETNKFDQPWDEEAHTVWKELLLQKFSRWLVTPGELGWDTTLQDIWTREGLPEDEGRIIITYNDIHTDTTLFYPEVLEKWGDVNEPEDLRRYLEEEVKTAQNNPDYQPWKPNCQLTPTASDIILGRWSGLREMADAVNRNVTEWRRGGRYFKFMHTLSLFQKCDIMQEGWKIFQDYAPIVLVSEM